MEVLLKVANDINKEFGNIIKAPHSLNEEGLKRELSKAYKELIVNNFDKFINFIKEYEFPKDFPNYFSFSFGWYSNISRSSTGIKINGEKIHKLWEANIYAGGTIKDCNILHSILYNNPALFIKLYEKKLISESINFFCCSSYNMLYPYNDTAVEIFIEKFFYPFIKKNIVKGNFMLLSIKIFESWTINLKDDIFEKIYQKFQECIKIACNEKGKITSEFWYILLNSLEIIKRKPNFLIALCKLADIGYLKKILHKYKKDNEAPEVTKVFSKLPAEVIIDDNIPHQLLFFAAGNKNLVNSKKFKPIFNEILKNPYSSIELIHECIRLPEEILLQMKEEQFNDFMNSIAVHYYGIKFIFPFKIIPEKIRDKVKSNFIAKKLIEKLLRKYEFHEMSNYVKAEIVGYIIENGRQKGLNNDEIDMLIEIFLTYSEDYFFNENINNIRNTIGVPHKYIPILKKFLYSQNTMQSSGNKIKQNSCKNIEQMQLFAA